jgi:hypothetical protein
MKETNRGEFLKVAGGALASAMIFGCARENTEHSHTPRDTLPPTNQLSGYEQLNERATAYEQAVRLNPPEPPRPVKTWQNGAFITKVLLPRENRSFAFTIDDGPSPYNSELVLRESEKLGIHVTPFLIGVNIIA